MLKLYTGSIEMVSINVSSRIPLDAAAVSIGFTTTADIPPTVWTSGSWESMQPVVGDMGDSYARAVVARVLVGAAVAGGNITLAKGAYWVWIKIVTSNETIVKLAGQTTVV